MGRTRVRPQEAGMRRRMDLKLHCLLPAVGSAQNTPWLQRFLFATHGSLAGICALTRVLHSCLSPWFPECLLPLLFGHVLIVKNACVIPTFNKVLLPEISSHHEFSTRSCVSSDAPGPPRLWFLSPRQEHRYAAQRRVELMKHRPVGSRGSHPGSERCCSPPP